MSPADALRSNYNTLLKALKALHDACLAVQAIKNSMKPEGDYTPAVQVMGIEEGYRAAVERAGLVLSGGEA